eukprot:419294-Rhodomonas_salina.3
MSRLYNVVGRHRVDVVHAVGADASRLCSVGGPNSEQVLRLERLKMTQRKQEVKVRRCPM